MTELDEKRTAEEKPECCGRAKDRGLLTQLALLLRTFAIAVLAHLAASFWHIS